MIAFSLVAVPLYLIAAWMLFRAYRRGAHGRAGLQRRATVVLAACALLLQAVGLVHAMVTPAAVNLDFGNALDLTGAAVVAVVLLGALFEPVVPAGILVFPLAALTALAPSVHEPPFVVRTGHALLDAHIVTAVLAYAILALAAVEAILLWIQESRLKRAYESDDLVGLPPLLMTERMLFQLIAAGFVLLTFVLVSGLVYLHELIALHLLPKAVISLLAWFLFGALLYGRRRYGWRGRVAAGWTLGAFTLLVLAYLGTKLLWELAAAAPIHPVLG
jgi:ABC-type uncharacterized transport system permease subunit